MSMERVLEIGNYLTTLLHFTLIWYFIWMLWFYFIVKFLLWIVVAVNFYPMHAFLGKPYYWQEFKIKPWKLKKDMSYMWWYNSMFPFYCFCKRNEVEVNLNRGFFSIFFSLAYRNQVKQMFPREFITFIY